MLFDAIVLPSQAVIPLGIALAHLALCLVVVVRRRFSSDATVRLFIAYLLLSTLWNVNLVAVVVGNMSASLPGLSWVQLVPYGLIILGVLYWAFARAFLQQSWTAPWGWGLGLAGLVLAISLNVGWLRLPVATVAWSNGWLIAANVSFVLSAIWWGLFMMLTFLTAELQRFRTQSPPHKNRIQYLLIVTILLVAGYGMYLSLREPFWTTGLIVTWLGSALATYIIVVEDLLDLGTGVRRTISVLVVVLVAVVVYIVGIYLVQIFLGDFLASTFLIRFLEPSLLVATVTAVFLIIVYTPIQRLSQGVTNRILFGQHYDYQVVIQDYTQAISNIVHLEELVSVALGHIKQTLDIPEGILFMRDLEAPDQFHFYTLPTLATKRFPETLLLSGDTPIIHRLVDERQPLAQYTIDISPQFKHAPEQELQALKALKLEWFIPILKQEQLIGIFALGPKSTQQPYSAGDIRLLTTLADQTALALENANLVDRLQQNLQETTRMKNLMDNVFDSMDNGVVTTDLGGRITFFNRAAVSILALPLNNSINKLYTQVLPSLAKTIFPNLVANVLSRSNRYTDYEIISELPGRGRVNLNMNLAPLKDAQNQIRGVTMVMDDLTETKRLEAVQDMFRRYVSPAVVDRLPANPSELKLGGHRQEITVLFADLRGFSTFGERLMPEKLVDTLNEYLTMAAASILMYEGTLDKFIGDAVMGLFNAPLEQKDHTLRAVRAAWAIQQAVVDYHHNIGGNQDLCFGVGLHVGEAVVGNVGMSDRMDYTAIGDTVNLAWRIQENTPGGKVLMSEAVYEIVADSVKSVFHKELKVKGREQPVHTYELQSVS